LKGSLLVYTANPVKTYFTLTLVLGLFCHLSFSAPAPRADEAANIELRRWQLAPPTKTPWQATERTAGQTRWQSVTTFSNVLTRKLTFQTNSFTELGAGLNLQDVKGGFVPADPGFQITAAGAEAKAAAHQVIVPADIGLGGGIKIVTPAGEELVFQPLGLNLL